MVDVSILTTTTIVEIPAPGESAVSAAARASAAAAAISATNSNASAVIAEDASILAEAAADRATSAVANGAQQFATEAELLAYAPPDGYIAVLYVDSGSRIKGQYRRTSGAWPATPESDILSGVDDRVQLIEGVFQNDKEDLLLQRNPGLDELPVRPLVMDENGLNLIGYNPEGHLEFTATRAVATDLRKSSLDYAQVMDRLPRETDDIGVGRLWRSGERVYQQIATDGQYASWARAKISSYNYGGSIVSRRSVPLPGDVVPGLAPICAAGFHRLVESYSGACARISKDSAPSGAYIDLLLLEDGHPDMAQLTAFLAGEKGRVLTVYDQSGLGNDLTWTGTDAPAIWPSPIAGAWLVAQMEDGAAYNSDYLPREGLVIPAGVTMDAANHSAFWFGAMNHSSIAAPIIEFNTDGGDAGSFALNKRVSSSNEGFVIQVNGAATIAAVIREEPHLSGLMVGYTSSASALTMYHSDQFTATGTARPSATLAGGQIGLTTNSSVDSGGNPREGNQSTAAILVWDRALTSSETADLYHSLTHHAELAPQVTAKFICTGDSITRGAGRKYGDALPRRIARALHVPVEPYNFGISGATIASMWGGFDNTASKPYDANSPFVLYYDSAGTNDLPQSSLTVEDIYADAKTLIDMAKALGSNVITARSTIRPRNSYNVDAVLEAKRQSLNTMFREGFASGDLGCDFLVDFDLDPIMGVPSVAADSDYYLDGTHQSDLGAQTEAEFVAAQFNTFLRSLGWY